MEVLASLPEERILLTDCERPTRVEAETDEVNGRTSRASWKMSLSSLARPASIAGVGLRETSLLS